MKKDKEGTLWMWTGDEGIMDEDGYLRSKLSESHSLARSPVSSCWKDKGLFGLHSNNND